MLRLPVVGVLAAALAVTGSNLWPASWRLSSEVHATHPSSCEVPRVGKAYKVMLYAAVHKHWSPERAPYWCWGMAQLHAESGFDSQAVSPAGARGLAQFMPATALEVGIDPWDTAQAIDGYARYMETLSTVWHSPRPERRRIELAAASYNAGAGTIIRAQRMAHGAREWDGMAHFAPMETQNYLNRIRQSAREYTGVNWE